MHAVLFHEGRCDITNNRAWVRRWLCERQLSLVGSRSWSLQIKIKKYGYQTFHCSLSMYEYTFGFLSSFLDQGFW